VRWEILSALSASIGTRRIWVQKKQRQRCAHIDLSLIARRAAHARLSDGLKQTLEASAKAAAREPIDFAVSIAACDRIFGASPPDRGRFSEDQGGILGQEYFG